MALPRALVPFRHADYRWLAAALVLSITGAGLWLVAMAVVLDRDRHKEGIEATFTFSFDGQAPHQITGIAVDIDRGPGV